MIRAKQQTSKPGAHVPWLFVAFPIQITNNAFVKDQDSFPLEVSVGMLSEFILVLLHTFILVICRILYQVQQALVSYALSRNILKLSTLVCFGKHVLHHSNNNANISTGPTANMSFPSGESFRFSLLGSHSTGMWARCAISNSRRLIWLSGI